MTRDPLAHVERLIPRVYAYAAYRLGDGADAEDATSETFERAIRYANSFDRRKGEPVAWLIGIARRVVDDQLSARSRLSFEDVPDVAAPDDLAGDALDRLELSRALARLDGRARELVALRYGADLATRQIAELLDLRANTVAVALHRALGQLRRELEEPVTKRRLARYRERQQPSAARRAG